MKNSLFLALIANFVFHTVLAQQEVVAPKQFLGKVSPQSVEKIQHALSKAQQNDSGWWKPVKSLGLLTTLSTYVDFLMPDTNAVFVPAPGGQVSKPYHHRWVAAGLVFDPSDPNLSSQNPNNPITYSRFTKYSVDSVLFPYVYIRYVDSIELNGNKQEVVDTLILQFFTKDNLSLGYFNNQSRERENFARPTNLDHKSLTYPNNSYTIKIPLTDSNATENPTDGTWKQKVWRQAIPLNNKIPEDPNLKNLNIAGFQFAFKTMIPINHGDTMESLNGSIPKKRLNYFGYSLYLGQQGTQVKQIKHINNAFFSFGNQAYGAEENTWKSNTPGNAFFNDRYVQGLFYTKTQNLSIENLKKKYIGLGDAYPNPSKGSSFVNIDYKLPHSQNVEFKIFDLTGKTVQSTSTKSNHSGVNTIQINVEHLNDGLYLYQMKTDGFQEVQKLIIRH